MRRFLGFDSTMILAERIARITIFLSLVLMMLAPIPLIAVAGAGPFAFFWPFFIMPGLYTLRGTCKKFNLFHYIFLLLCTTAALSAQIQPIVALLLPIVLFCFLLYFQAERRLYYLLELTDCENSISAAPQDPKPLCKAYFLNCCKNAILPTIIGSMIGYATGKCGGAAWGVSCCCLLVCGFIYFFLKSRTD